RHLHAVRLLHRALNVTVVTIHRGHRRCRRHGAAERSINTGVPRAPLAHQQREPHAIVLVGHPFHPPAA
ncbi:unnamed protein product, partial [Ectocarpus sp. 4 AP-2014]